MPLPVHMILEGAKQGKIDGSCDQKGRENTILIEALDHEVFIPRDPQTGLGTGKRVHKPLTIMKHVDKASPKLYLALCSGEHLTNVELKFYRISPTGEEEHYFTTALTEAIIVSITPWMPNCLDRNSDSFGHMEKVALTYQKATWTWVPDGIEAADDWKEPVSA